MRWFKIATLFISLLILISISFYMNINTLMLYGNKTKSIKHMYLQYFGNYDIEIDVDRLYAQIGLEPILDKDIFEYSLTGYTNLIKNNLIKKKSLLTIIDYTKPSTEKRLYVIDLYDKKLLFNSLVAHGKNTGVKYPRYFSNEVGSLQSSLGFFITLGTYFGQNGYSLKLRGVDDDFNDKAEDRYIVMHGADYVSEGFIKEHGRIGRSWGCPAVPNEITSSLINIIKEGSSVFIYHNDTKYLNSSKYLNTKIASITKRKRHSLL